MHLRLEHWKSPVCTIFLVTDDDGNLRALDFAGHQARMARLLRRHYGHYTLTEGPAPLTITCALAAYFKGDIAALDTIKTATAGTPFQRQVWQALRTIPAGTTTSYGRLAQKLGRPSASRAVGAANATNPIAIVVPCHRVIGATGSLTGFASGLPNKRWLLDHETRFAGAALPLAAPPLRH
jgi:methylated-DNA-[protein]-cysteine S-methyltransferase